MVSAAEYRKLHDELQNWIRAEQEVSAAYVRLRVMIPGALDTPHAPSLEQVVAVTEAALKRALKL